MKAGYRNWQTISRSVTLDRTDVIDIGRKSDSSLGLAVLATGQIEARFHWDGTTEVDNDRLISCAKGFANTAAPSLRNQAGTSSSPVLRWHGECQVP